MGKRILTAVIWLPIVGLGFAFAPMIVIALAICVLSAVGAYELLWATGFVRQKRLCAYAMIFAALVPIWVYFGSDPRWMLAAVFTFILVGFIDAMVNQKTIKFEMVVGAFFGAFVVPYFLSAFLRIEMLEQTRLILALPLVYAFLSDAGGYFVGRICGKHKLAPSLSPKKTAEGSVGALAFSVVGGILFGFVGQFLFGMQVNYLALALFGIPMSIIAQLGDLTFSYIKREFGIKDYGNLFLGHGGVLDRFDSVTFAAPFLELLLCLIPVLH